MAFIRTAKTGSGATAVQIAHKSHGQIIRIEHIGSAHSDAELQLLLTLARQRLLGNQRALFSEPADRTTRIGLKRSFSDLLLQVLYEQYRQLGFDQLADEDFAYLCVARLVEPTSKLDSLRVLTDLGITGQSHLA